MRTYFKAFKFTLSHQAKSCTDNVVVFVVVVVVLVVPLFSKQHLKTRSSPLALAIVLYEYLDQRQTDYEQLAGAAAQCMLL